MVHDQAGSNDPEHAHIRTVASAMLQKAICHLTAGCCWPSTTCRWTLGMLEEVVAFLNTGGITLLLFYEHGDWSVSRC